MILLTYIIYIISLILLYFILKRIYVKQLIYKGTYSEYNKYQKTENDKKLKHSLIFIIFLIIIFFIPLLNIIIYITYLMIRLCNENGKINNPYYIKSDFIDNIISVLNKEY